VEGRTPTVGGASHTPILGLGTRFSVSTATSERHRQVSRHEGAATWLFAVVSPMQRECSQTAGESGERILGGREDTDRRSC
jgi:hypothetical protein